MSDQHFDDFIKQKLRNHASPVAEGMWDRIAAQKDKERRGGWWLQKRATGLGLAILLLSGIIYFSATRWNSSLFSKESNESIITRNNKSSDLLNEGGSVAENGKQSTQLPTNLDDDATVVTPPSTGPGKSITQPGETRASSLQPGSIKRPLKQGVANDTRNEFFSSQSFTSKEHSLTRLNAGNIAPIERMMNEELSEQTQVANYIAETQSAGEQIKNSRQLLSQLKLLPITECPSAMGDQRNDWYIEVFGAPDLAIKSTRGENDEYLRRKDSSEKLTSAFTAGIRLSKNIGEHLLLKTGIQYSQINERFDFKSENERKTITVVTIRTIIRGPGDTLRVTDTSTLQQIGYRVKTTYNRYRSVDIPLIVGYEWGNESFKTNINAGLIFNLQSWQQGDMLDTSFTPVTFDKSNQVFKQNIGIGLYAGVAFLKTIGARTEIFAEPYLRYNLSNMTRSASPFNQRFHVAGLNIGIRYKLNGGRQQ